jgi:hypothetical protein
METNIEQDLASMNEAVDIINQLIAVESLSYDEKTTLRVKTDYLSGMLGKDDVVAYTGDKTVYITAINAGYSKLN